MLLAGRFPPDIRVEKEARALLGAGHELHLLCFGRATEQASGNEVWEGIAIHRINPVRDLPVPLRKLNGALWVSTFFDAFWAKNVNRLVRDHLIDSLHVHDLPMLRTAVRVGQKTGLPVIADFHENYPDSLRIGLTLRRRSLLKRWNRKIRDNPRRWARYERAYAKKADRVVTVVEEMRTRLVDLGIPAEKVEVVENTEDLSHFRGMGVDERIVQQYGNGFVITYVGGFGPHRGLDTAIKAMPAVVRQVPDAKLLLVGDGPIRGDLEALAQRLRLDGAVEFAGQQDFSKVPSFIEASAVCLVPHHSTPQTEPALPHKLFQYMAMERPVVASSCRAVARVVNETGGGVVFPAGDSDGLARAILSLSDRDLRRKLGKAGRSAVETRYNWDHSSRKLLRIYEQMGSR